MRQFTINFHDIVLHCLQNFHDIAHIRFSFHVLGDLRPEPIFRPTSALYLEFAEDVLVEGSDRDAGCAYDALSDYHYYGEYYRGSDSIWSQRDSSTSVHTLSAMTRETWPAPVYTPRFCGSAFSVGSESDELGDDWQSYYGSAFDVLPRSVKGLRLQGDVRLGYQGWA
jgi:hypothetical protein